MLGKFSLYNLRPGVEQRGLLVNLPNLKYSKEKSVFPFWNKVFSFKARRNIESYLQEFELQLPSSTFLMDKKIMKDKAMSHIFKFYV